MRPKFRVALLAICLFFSNCANSDSNEINRGQKPTEGTAILTAKATLNDDDLTVDLHGSIELFGFTEADITEFGFLYGTDRTTDYINEYAKATPTGLFSDFTASIAFQPEVTYLYAVAYLKVNREIFYSRREFLTMTSQSKISVNISTDFSGDTFDQVTVTGSCFTEKPKLFPITERGFCYINTNEIQGRNPVITDGRMAAGSGVGEFSATITGLQPKAGYKIRTYAINAQGVQYSKNYITVALMGKTPFLPSCYTYIDFLDPTKITGGIFSDNGYNIVEKGFCYNALGRTPTVDDVKIPCGDGIGSFEYDLTQLSSGKYYFRAYAVNLAGCGYSPFTEEVVVP